ncbi:MAG: 3-deoxy-D-manno-octulosonate 8-phosphate phosphatase [Bacteroidetes bacterium GWA2_32_17]|nr:MAG: 3-deoxy-D-manno-octulosonate 8-phosphate phosphatase [Bacteroidetes bacterium GWA2_32_17]
MANYKEKLTHIKAFAFDVDGVFSGNITLTESGEQLRTMNIKDGYAVQLAIKKGFQIAIITGGFSEGIRKRFEGLGIKDIYMRSEQKTKEFHNFIAKYSLQPSEVVYMGDDLPDYEVMKIAGLPVCPANSAIEIKEISKYISAIDGGNGCVRDIIEQVLRSQGKWMNNDAFKW